MAVYIQFKGKYCTLPQNSLKKLRGIQFNVILVTLVSVCNVSILLPVPNLNYLHYPRYCLEQNLVDLLTTL